MTINVSISQLRNNISSYLEKVIGGDRVLIRDEKKDTEIAQIIKSESFDKNTYEKILRKAAGIVTSKNHPEWATKTKVMNWVKKSRLSDDRKY